MATLTFVVSDVQYPMIGFQNLQSILSIFEFLGKREPGQDRVGSTHRIKVTTLCADGQDVVPNLPVVVVSFGRLLKNVPGLVILF